MKHTYEIGDLYVITDKWYTSWNGWELDAENEQLLLTGKGHYMIKSVHSVGGKQTVGHVAEIVKFYPSSTTSGYVYLPFCGLYTNCDFYTTLKPLK
jgi:hypothetical protein